MAIIEAAFENEKELQNWIENNLNDFLPGAFFLPGCRIMTVSGKGGVPDGFAFNFDDENRHEARGERCR